ncbi:MAG: hypothetical protein IJL15_05935 [Clostridia bacterium]|nr:hypothetical protein [Clostridia bacterium]
MAGLDFGKAKANAFAFLLWRINCGKGSFGGFYCARQLNLEISGGTAP